MTNRTTWQNNVYAWLKHLALEKYSVLAFSFRSDFKFEPDFLFHHYSYIVDSNQVLDNHFCS